MRCPGCHVDLPPPADPTQRHVRCGGCGKDVDLAAAASGEGTVDQRPKPPPAGEPAPDPLLGTTFAGGRYRIEGLLGVGGMGRVYRATQTALGRPVALKILAPDLAADEQFRRRFDREAGTLASLDHPHIVAIHDMGAEGGTPYIVMALVVGPGGAPVSLRSLLDAGPVDEDLCLRIIQQTCAALDYAHKKGVIHRDIKPANILLDGQGNAKIADFGIARAAGADAAALTTTGAVLGTLKYMAPEQMSDASKADPRSDLYSLGVVFYEMLTGHAPVGRFEMPSEERTGLDRRLDDIVDRALRRVADQRYQTADQMARDLSRITTERELVRLGGKPTPPEREPKRAPSSSAPPPSRADAAPAASPPPAASAPPAAASARAPRRGVPTAAWVGLALLAAGLGSIPLWATGKPTPAATPPKLAGAATGGTPAMADVPAMGEPSMAGPAMADPAMADPAMADPAMADPGMAGAAMAEPAMSTWATDMPAPMGDPPPSPPPAKPETVEPEVAEARATLLTLVGGSGISPEDVASMQGTLAAMKSGADADTKGASAAVVAALDALSRKDLDALDRALPAAVVGAKAKSLVKADEVEGRRALRADLADLAIRDGKVGTAVPVGREWVLVPISAFDVDEEARIEGAALAIREGDRWKVALFW